VPLVVADAAADDEEVGAALAGRVEEQRPDVVGVLRRFGPGLLGSGLESAAGLAEEEHAGLPVGSAHKDVGKAVAVDVGDGDGGPVHSLAPGKEALAPELVGGL